VSSTQIEELQNVCLTFLEQLLIGEMEASYGDSWQQIIKVIFFLNWKQ
jgi:hypothetical protein